METPCSCTSMYPQDTGRPDHKKAAGFEAAAFIKIGLLLGIYFLTLDFYNRPLFVLPKGKHIVASNHRWSLKKSHGLIIMF